MSPAMPFFTSRKTLRPPAAMKTPSCSTLAPFFPGSSLSRITRAAIGTARTSFFSSMMMSAVAEKPGFSVSGGWSRVMTVLKSLDSAVVVLAALAEVMAELPTSVTVPFMILPGMASTVTSARLPIRTFTTSVSSTRTSASMTERSAMVSSTVPGLFMVPMMATSPSSTFRLVTMPSMGETMEVLRMASLVLFSEALACSMRCRFDCLLASAISNWMPASSNCSLEISPSSKSCLRRSR